VKLYLIINIKYDLQFVSSVVMILLQASYFSKYEALLESVVESLSLSELFVFKKL
jgi:hypothetical protein